jgi:hypothetical protein
VLMASLDLAYCFVWAASNFGLLVSLHVRVVLDNVGPRGLGGLSINLGDFVLDFKLGFFLLRSQFLSA